MNPTLISSSILAVLTLVESLLPQLGVVGASASIIDNVIRALVKIVPVLEKIAPLVGDEASLLYQGVKNIIANLRSDSVSTSAQQDADLDALDARVDAAWDSVSTQFDPDAPKGDAA